MLTKARIIGLSILLRKDNHGDFARLAVPVYQYSGVEQVVLLDCFFMIFDTKILLHILNQGGTVKLQMQARLSPQGANPKK